MDNYLSNVMFITKKVSKMHNLFIRIIQAGKEVMGTILKTWKKSYYDQNSYVVNIVF